MQPTDNAVLVTGGSGFQGTVLTLIDAHTLQIIAQIRPRLDDGGWTILPYKGRFYLLNVGSFAQPRGDAGDLLIIDPANPAEILRQEIAPAPVYGVIDDDVLYAYHNSTDGTTNMDATRLFSRTDLVTGESEVWSLPDNWDAKDVDVLGVQVVLTHWDVPDEGKDGLYAFDFASGELTQLLHIKEATGIIVVHE